MSRFSSVVMTPNSAALKRASEIHSKGRSPLPFELFPADAAGQVGVLCPFVSVTVEGL
jgi:hypothetical protein